MSKKEDPAKKKFPGKITLPDTPMYQSQKQWEQRLSKMKKTVIKLPKPLAQAPKPTENKSTVGSTYGLTRKQLTQKAQEESRKKK